MKRRSLSRSSARRPLLLGLVAALLAGLLPAAAPVARADDPLFAFPRALVGSEGASQSVAAADFNRDGAADLVVGYSTDPARGFPARQPQLFLNRNDGSGEFLAPVNLPALPGAAAPPDAVDIAAGDVDGQNGPDLVIAAGAEPPLLLLNTGGGSFAAPVALDTLGVSDYYGFPIPGLNERFFTSVALADLSGDGRLDIVLGAYFSISQVLRGQGGASFAPPDVLYSNLGSSLFERAATVVSGLAVGDVDGQGGPDIVAASNLGAAGISSLVYLNDGSGDVDGPDDDAPIPALALAGSLSAEDAALGDVNGDGRLDILLASSATPTDDDNNPGTPPVFVRDPSQLYLNSPANPVGFGQPVALPESSNLGTAGALVDLNGDGPLDVVLANSGSPGSQFFQSRGAGSFTAPRAIVASIIDSRDLAVADFNGDGRPDLALMSYGNVAQVFLNRLAGSQLSAQFAPPTSLTSVSYNNLGVRAGDLNSDGWLDLVLAISRFTGSQRPGPSQVLLNRGDGSGLFLPGRPIAGSDESSQDAALGDVNGDGWLDLVLASRAERSQLFLNKADGSGDFGPPVPLPDVGVPEGRTVALGDLDGDGWLDIAHGYKSDPARWFRNDPASPGSFADQGALPGSNVGTLNIALADLDGQNGLDIILAHYVGANLQPVPAQVYLNQGGGAFPGPALLPESAIATNGVAVGDLDGDADLDIALSSFGRSSRVYFNNGQGGFASQRPLAGSGDYSIGISAGDLNGDGALDLLLGNYLGQLSQIFLNHGDGRFAPPARVAGSGKNTTRVALGDFNGDSALDLVLASTDQLSQLFLNSGASGIAAPTPVAGSGRNSLAPALGDLDGDGDLDLVLGNHGEPSQLFLNQGGGFGPPADLPGGSVVSTTQTLVGDLSNDGRLDLVLANRAQPSQLYLNGPGGLGAPLNLPDSDNGAQGGALGDLNGDGALDIVLANNGLAQGDERVLRPSRVYLNSAASPGSFGAPTQLRGSGDSSTAVAVGDLNGDSAPDIVLANYSLPSLIYYNDGSGDFSQTEPISLTGEPREVQDLALADLDGDGALDIVLGAFKQPARVYVNKGDGSFGEPYDIAGSGNAVNRIAAGDLNGDGAPDLVLSSSFNQPSQIFLNRGGALGTPIEILGSGGGVLGVALGDVDRDGGLDMVLGTGRGIRSTGSDQLSLLYRNRLPRGARLPDNPPTVSLRRPGTPEAGLLSTPTILDSQVISVSYTLADREGDPVSRVRAYFSLNGGNSWRPAAPSAATDTSDLAAPPAGQAHTFGWNTYASDFFGQSDEVVFRIVAEPGVRRREGAAPGPYQRAYAAAVSAPFRVRGTQVRVVSGAGPGAAPVAGAVVYRIAAGTSRGGLPVAVRPGAPAFTTNAQGFLRGRGEIGQGDQLIALARIVTTDVYSNSYDLYQTNITPQPDGLGGFTVGGDGVQTISVSPSRPLALFNLIVSLEWDARSDARYMSQLRYDLQRTSEFLFDATNGQAALGYVDVYHDKEMWNYAHIRIYASNRVRPSAQIGGVASAELSLDPDGAGPLRPLSYGPGLLKMGAVWSRFGNAAGGSLSEDWPRTLAHELGHYLFFLEDNYLGLDGEGRLKPVESCPGLMGDPYSSVELRPQAGWSPACAETLSQKLLGRSDWRTLKSFFPQLVEPTVGFEHPSMAGPSTLPLAVTEIYPIEPTYTVTPTGALDVPIFYTVDPGGARYQPGPRATAYLFQRSPADPDPGYDRLINMGRANLDQILARGARVGDRVCLFEPASSRLGCEEVRAGDERLTVRQDPAWRPDLVVTPVSSRTLSLELRTLGAAGAPANTGVTAATAYIYPSDNLIPVRSAALTAPAGGPAGVFRGQVTLDEPVLEGYIHVVASPAAPLREAVSSFSVGGNPGPIRIGGGPIRIGGGAIRIGGGAIRIGGGAIRIGGGAIRIGGGAIRIGGGAIRIGGAPVASAEGDVLLLADEVPFDVGDLVTLQSVPTLPDPPAWATIIGSGYRLTASAGAPSLAGTQISFGYQGSEVPAGEEEAISVYFRAPNATAWTLLPTTRNSYHNLVAAENQGEGLYALMSSVAIPLQGPGFNLFGYPVRGSRPVAEALRKIDGFYNAVYGYDPGDPANPWRRYFPDQPAWVNNLASLEFGKGYWIDVDEDIELLLRGEGGAPASLTTSTPALPLPPASYFGVIGAGEGFTPAAGQLVEARVGAVVCGRGTTIQQGAQVVYVVDVRADGGGETAGCGASGRTVSFSVAGRQMNSAAWGGAGPRPLNLAPEPIVDDTHWLYLPALWK